MRPLKFLVGLALLPLCAAATRTFGSLLHALQPGSLDRLPRSIAGLLIGFFLWIFVYLVLPRPMRTYVLAHELTHGLWAWVTGAQVHGMKIGRRGGRIWISGDNFLIALSPYFFPLYTALVILAYGASALFFDLRVYEPFWLGLIGLTWAFHLTFTVSMLSRPQPDVLQHGRLFSYAFIYLMNVLALSLGVVAIGSPTLEAFAAQLAEHARAAYGAAAAWGGRLVSALAPLAQAWPPARGARGL